MKRIFLFILLILSLSGCAVSTRYVKYTDAKFEPKPKYYFVSLYNAQPPVSTPYTIIGRVELWGSPNDGVTPQSLTDEAKIIARKRGADAIIHAQSIVAPRRGVEIVPAHVTYHRYWGRYHPARYIPYDATTLQFTGELIVFRSPVPEPS